MAVIIIFCLFIIKAKSSCVFTQNCTGGTCNPPYKTDPYSPFMANWTDKPACPMFIGQEVCCNSDQNKAMILKYQVLDGTFGTDSGGCDICAANLKKLWCYFTCSPDQDIFVSPGPQALVPSPVGGGLLQIMLVNFTVTNGVACEIYQSCQKCSYVTQVSAMQSSQGFLQFQGYEGMTIGLLWTTFLFNDGPSALDMSFLPCSKNISNAYGYPVTPCSCNSCEDKCAADYYVAQPSTLNGLDWAIVGFFYLGLLIVSMVILFVQYKINKKKQLEENNISTLREMDESGEFS